MSLLQAEPVYKFEVEFVTGSFTDLTSRFERGNWGSTITDMFSPPLVGHGLFELHNGDGLMSPRNNVNLLPGKAVRLRASHNGALRFTAASSQRGDTAASSYFNHATQATLEAWVNPTSLVLGGVLDTSLGDVTNTSRLLFLEGNLMRFRLGLNGSSLYTVTDPTTPVLGTPLHYLGTCFVGSYAALYRSGVLVSSLSVPVGSLGMGATIKQRLGSLAGDAPTYRWEGVIDDALTWVRGVTAAEAAKHAVGSFDNLLGLVGRWKMNEGRGSFVKDSSGLGHDLTLSGAAAMPNWVRGIATDTTSAPLFFGRISEISGSSRLGDRTTVLECADDLDRVSRLRYTTNLFLDTNVRSLFTSLMSASAVNSFSIDSIVDQVGFAWYRDQGALDSLHGLVQSGNYQLAVDGDGTYYLRDRYWPFFATEVGTYDIGQDIRAGLSERTIVNRVKMNCDPRRPSTDVTTLAFLTDISYIPQSTAISVWMTYQDPNEPSLEVPVMSIVTQVKSTDYYGAAYVGGTGTDMSSALAISLTSFASTAIASIYNGGAQGAWLTRFQVRGFPVLRVPPIGVQKDISSSQAVYGVRELTVENVLVQNRPFMDSLASTIAFERRNGRQNLKLSLINEFDDVLRNKNGDICSVVDSFGGNTAQWRIRSVNHDLELMRGLRHSVSYDMQLQDTAPWLVLDHATFGQLDNGRVLGI